MKSALRRQLEITAWQALGFALGGLVLLGGITLWGAGIEGRVGDVEQAQRHDRKRIVAIEKGHPLGTPNSSKSVQPLGVAGGDADTPPPGHEQPGPHSWGGQVGQGDSGPSAPLPENPGVSNPPSPEPQPPAPQPPPVSGNDDKPRAPLAPVVEELVPPVAAPAVENVCSKAAAVTPIC